MGGVRAVLDILLAARADPMERSIGTERFDYLIVDNVEHPTEN